MGINILLLFLCGGVVDWANGSAGPVSLGLRSSFARTSSLGSSVIHHPSNSRRSDDAAPWAPRWPRRGRRIRKQQCAPVDSVSRGGASAVTERKLAFWEAMVCGAISRSTAQTIMHPANVMKTILQSKRTIPGQAPLTVASFTQWRYAQKLSRGAGAQLLLSLPHGAVNFAVLEFVRRQMHGLVSKSPYAEQINRNFGAGMDFLSSAISTVCCSVVSTPQMMICDNIMAGTYPNLASATSNLIKDRGVAGFYTGWWPGIAGKIPSYGLTWTLFEQIKRIRATISDRPAMDLENSIMGCIASATTVCVMIPMDTVKTRLVTQSKFPDLVPYEGINDCFRRIMQEEGVGAFYRGLTPRLLSVVPMIGIQFGVYGPKMEQGDSRKSRLLTEIAMEVGADDDQPFPSPYPSKNGWWARRAKR
ncbi:hypothetical protein THAOC_02295 [Thalassiosira oceanica]|uniref:Mitochondrial carrier protein n=1 Tax=Thalassiosira oceanica TaxID=159749 RepID=K0TM79_THAOC|nr:hypothetical protein THAOC_02295 [Thalassiosira oceanica]|eukprot:EJK75966.1 hypothetical protein THAOC_02295 [Thalassiosira oceanica]